MNKAKINELYEKAYVTYEVPYESSVVDPTIVSIHKQRVWDRHLFAELIVRECAKVCDDLDIDDWGDKSFDDGTYYCSRAIKQHFGVEE